ncbi:RING-type domain-containing protein [Caenorhabditis elegans]|uniref:RING-type domain-containing protein n=1 Tax=Caenorhabditis elegans TaxID=6239 RepID=Q4R161_CAEEL|nr:RING-type domain-containing protein [Caenorhabditis elegans]CCD83528.2 RING-type domain-containing protein [Caenorhabditis elegans]|eukprot:NP_001343694.1 Uncharacterized protein CELE_Y54G2A.40 [Caenorhabditis elegans]
MFHLASLICSGCEDGETNQFYDNLEKRQCYCSCQHSLCTQCFNKYKNCPICAKPLVRTENYAARQIYEQFKENPMIVFNKWWCSIQNTDAPEMCPSCHVDRRKFHWCIECEMKLENSEAKFRRARIFPRTDLQKQLCKISGVRFGFAIFASRVICSDCVLQDHDGHHIVSVKNLYAAMMNDKSITGSATQVATQFLWSEIAERSGKCLLRTMRLKRACLKLFWTARAPSYNIFSVDQSKFFEPLVQMSDDYIDRVRKNVEHQFVCANSPWKNCNCTQIMRKMQELALKNQIEKRYVEIVSELELQEITECPLKMERVQDLLDKSNKMSRMQLHKLYTVFCWNYYRTDTYELFNETDRKPLICSQCKVSTCFECYNRLYNECGFCECSIMAVFLKYKDDVEARTNHEALELLKFYKENCIEVLEEWWASDAFQLGFCLSCSSYSEDLEICVYCELVLRRSVLRTDAESPDNFKKGMKIRFNYKWLGGLPLRWQCSDCVDRLFKEDQGAWKQGCNHFLQRRSPIKITKEYAEHNCKATVIRLKEIKNYGFALKSATFRLVFKILRAGIEEKGHFRNGISQTYWLLYSRIQYFLRNSLNGRKSVEMEELKVNISRLIGELKAHSYRNE